VSAQGSPLRGSCPGPESGFLRAPDRPRGSPQGGKGRSRRPGEHHCLAEGQRGRGGHRLLRFTRTDRVGRHPVRPLPFHRRRRVRAGHRPPARWLAQPRPRHRRHCGPRSHREALYRSPRRRRRDGAQGAQELGAGEVRCSAHPGWQDVPAGREVGRHVESRGLQAGRREPGARSRTGTRSWRPSRCMARAPSSTLG
jgi:hypothetical protein